MSASIHQLHPRNSSISGLIRVGRSSHRQLENLHAVGKLPFRKIVFDAPQINLQKDLLNTLSQKNFELILDTTFAEMSSIGKYNRKSHSLLPWGKSDRPTQPQDFARGNNVDIAKMIADFAAEHKFSAVLAPCHYINGASDEWFSFDRNICLELRSALDRIGANHISIDYPVILDASNFRKPETRHQIAHVLQELPIENVWLRISTFGATATASATRNFIESAFDFHSIQKPIIADYAGGFAAVGAAAIGAISGLCHGLARAESFRGGAEWRQPPMERKQQGSSRRIYLPDLDRFLDEKQLKLLFSTRGAKSRFGCIDAECCKHGIESMTGDRYAHFIHQRHMQIESITKVPDQRKAEQFLLRHLDPAIRSARAGVALRITDEKVAKVLEGSKVRLERMRDVFADLMEHHVDQPRARNSRFRGGPPSSSVVLGA